MSTEFHAGPSPAAAPPSKPFPAVLRLSSSAGPAARLGSATDDSRQKVFALIDCNNFFVSSERIFRPDLEHEPVVVLSSNDGCIVARSNEAKQLGIPMGAPAFKFRQDFATKGIVQFSANFELYGNISRRITDILRRVTPRIE